MFVCKTFYGDNITVTVEKDDLFVVLSNTLQTDLFW